MGYPEHEPSFKMYPAGWFCLAIFVIALLVAVGGKQPEQNSAKKSASEGVMPGRAQEDLYERSDRAARDMFARWDEMRLRQELVEIGAQQLKALDDPELLVRKALVAEALVRYDGKRGTTHWNRAQAHFEEAIGKWMAMPHPGKTEEKARRIAMLHLYAGQACCKQGLTDDAKAHFLQAAKHPAVEARARNELSACVR